MTDERTAEVMYDPVSWDVFICHASEDKDQVARPLAKMLREAGLRVWFDEFTLTVGDSLSRSIDHGLANSRHGIVIISPHFLAKEWPRKELAALVTREGLPEKVILPVWHDVTLERIQRHSPILADKIAVSSSLGLPEVTRQLLRAMNLDFAERSIAGLWVGNTGRLRLVGSGSEITGDYGWNGYLWAGHVVGTYNDGVYRFDWWWDRSREHGNGYFEHSPMRRTLRGGWAFKHDHVDTVRLAPEVLRDQVRDWRYVRYSA